MNKPNKIHQANLPTPIFEFNRMNPNKDKTNLFIKRDDYTGGETSGNKVRKLEYSLKEGLDLGADIFITCGGVQSNHCRATVSAAISLGKKAHLVLRGEDSAGAPDGNLLLDKLMGAEITFITADDYKFKRAQIMESIKEEYAAKGVNAYILPEGASNGIGLLGYYDAFEEILEQEKQMGIKFDVICSTEGSGGTYSGLFLANELTKANKKVIGFNIYDKNADVRQEIEGIVEEALTLLDVKEEINYDHIIMVNDYAGEGYGIAGPEVIRFIKEAAKATGIIFDPVYTGKALQGLMNEIKNNNPLFEGNVLFIHTGGLFGLFPKKDYFF